MPRQKGNGEGSIIKLPNGKYKGTVTVGVIYNPDNTVKSQPRKSFTDIKKSVVQRWVNEQINLRNKNMLAAPSEITVEQWLNNWLSKYKSNTLKPRTYESYKTVVDVHLIPAIGKKPLQQLKTCDLQDLYNQKISSGKSGRTVRYIHTIIHGALKQALKEGIILQNVSEACELPSHNPKKMQVLTENEIQQLLQANKSHRLYPLLLLELGTGLRRSELLALKWSDVDLDNQILYVRGNLSETQKGVIYQTPKTISSVREITIPEAIVRELELYKEKNKYRESDIIFPNQKGQYMRPSTLTQTFKDVLLKNAGLDQRSFHSLRHTHATMLLGKNTHMKVIQERLGHSSIGVTMDIYSHVLPNMQKEAAAKINDVFRFN